MLKKLIFWTSLTFLNSCSPPAVENLKTDPSSPTTENSAGASPGQLSILGEASMLPQCTKERLGVTFYIIAEQKFRYCDKNSNWETLDLKGSKITPLVTQVEEPKGKQCPFGGTKIAIGLDSNASSKLDTDEEVSTSYICNGGMVTPPPANAELVKLEVTPKNESGPAGFNPQFTAIAIWNNGMRLDVTESSLLEWSSSNSEVIQIHNFNGVRGLSYLVQPGTARVTATYDGNTKVRGYTDFVVDKAEIRYIGIDQEMELVPAISQLKFGQVRAYAYYSDYSRVDLTLSPDSVFSSSDSSVASVSNELETKGRVEGLAKGCASIQAVEPRIYEVPESKTSWLDRELKTAQPDSSQNQVVVRDPKTELTHSLFYKDTEYNGNGYSRVYLDSTVDEMFEIRIQALREDGQTVDSSLFNPTIELQKDETPGVSSLTHTFADSKFTFVANGEISAWVRVIFSNDGRDVYPTCGNRQMDGPQGLSDYSISTNDNASIDPNDNNPVTPPPQPTPRPLK